MIIHTCSRCEYTTNRISNYKRHMAAHEKEDARIRASGLVCPYCSRTFTEKTNCTRHKIHYCTKNPIRNSQPTDVDIQPSYIDIPSSDVDKRHICESCTKEYKTSDGLKLHIPKCRGVANILQCHKCMKILASYSTKCRHLKTCKGQPNVSTSASSGNTTINNTNNTTNNSIVNNVMNIQYNYNSFTKRPFGNENMEYINEDFIFKKIKDVGKFGMKDLIEAIYINPEHPENRNVWFGTGPSDSQSICYVLYEDGTRMVAFPEVMHNMCNKTFYVMMDLLDKMYMEVYQSTTLTKEQKDDKHVELQGYKDRVRLFGGDDGRRTPEYYSNRQAVLVSLRNVAKNIYAPVHPLISKQTSETRRSLLDLLDS